MSVVTELKWYDPKDDHPPWIKALAEVRQRATREGWCYQHVQAIIVAVDQYAEAALGNRDFFLNKPYSIGGSRDRKSTRLNSSHVKISYAVFCLKKKQNTTI